MAAAVIAMVAAALPMTAPGLAGAAADGDGTTSQTAGASCWGIKQQSPGAADGVYWVLTRLCRSRSSSTAT